MDDDGAKSIHGCIFPTASVSVYPPGLACPAHLEDIKLDTRSFQEDLSCQVPTMTHEAELSLPSKTT